MKGRRSFITAGLACSIMALWQTGSESDPDKTMVENTKNTSLPATLTYDEVRWAARTAWHTRPFGQVLIITAGVGRVQMEGGPSQEVH